jgi:hypothetical protein
MIVWRFSRLLKGPLMLSVAVKFWVLEMSFEDAGVVKSNPSRSIDDHKPEWSELHRAIESLILSILYPGNPTVSTSAAAIQLSPFYTLLKEPLTVGGQANRNVDLVLYTSITSRTALHQSPGMTSFMTCAKHLKWSILRTSIFIVDLCFA